MGAQGGSSRLNAPEPGEVGPRPRPSGWATAAAWILGGALVCALSVATERGFYYWDYSAYQNETLSAADQVRGFQAPGGNFKAPLFAVPLVPWVLLLGESRLVFVLAVYFTFFVPYLVLVVALAKRVWPGQDRRIEIVTTGATILTSASWSHVLQGYPDIAGAALMVASVLVYGSSRAGGLLVPLRIGVLAGLSVVLRRHYVYAVAALYAGICLDGIVSLMISRKAALPRFPLVRHLLGSVISGVVALSMIALVTPGFFAMALNASGEMAPYEQSVAATLIGMLGTVGALPLLLGTLGWLWIRQQRRPWPSELRLVVLATAAWIVIWSGWARQQPHHYPHWLPLFVILGLVWLWLALDGIRGRRMRGLVRATGLGLIVVGFVVSMPLLARGLTPAPAMKMFPDRVQLSSNPAYVSIIDLVHTLRQVAREDDPILVAASSTVLNPGVVRSAEVILYGRRHARLDILSSPQKDSQPLPTDMLLQAQVVVVAEPFQHHLAVEHQKVVNVLVEAFRQRWPISEDFELVPSGFPLPEPGGQIRVFRRRRPASPAVTADTMSRIEAFVFGHAFGDETWLVGSEFPSQAVRDPDGTTRIMAAPTRASTHNPTRVSLVGRSPRAAEVSAEVSFYDRRCEGIQVVAIIGDGDRPDEVPLGNFAPGAADAALRGRLPDLDGRPLALEIRSAPAHPENIDFCTIGLRSLKLAAAPESPRPAR